jgi:hypothetical protein
MNSLNAKIMVWFFAGGETKDNKFNVFTGSFIRLMKQILEKDFDFIKGIYFTTPIQNVAWALNNSQKPIENAGKNRIIDIAFRQLLSYGYSPDTQLIMVSSSTGSVIAAQTACYLAEKNSENLLFNKPFHLALGSSMISTHSDLYKHLIHYQKKGHIGKLIHNDLQDEGDNSTGAGSTSKFRAWLNAIGLIIPYISWKHKGPSFLNTHPENGHLHRKRSQTVQKALDYIHVLLIKHNLAGDYYNERAKAVIAEEFAPHAP